MWFHRRDRAAPNSRCRYCREGLLRRTLARPTDAADPQRHRSVATALHYCAGTVGRHQRDSRFHSGDVRVMSTTATKKMRLDNLLVARGFFDSRERAQRAIMAGDVQIGHRSVSKASELVAPNASVSIAHRPQYASRGALKLAGALDSFQIEVAG